jgi:predicted neuraminidase
MLPITNSFLFHAPPFAECHAATIVETSDGMLAAFFAGPHESHPETGIWTTRYSGGSWQELKEAVNGVQSDGSRFACWNPVLFRMPSGELLLFYKVGPSPMTWWGMLCRSHDNGRTWSLPERLPDGILGPIKNKPILRDDILLCPSSTESQENGWQVIIEHTADVGKTWKRVGPLNDGYHPGVIQPALVSLPEGSLLALCRTRGEGYIAVSRSADNGNTWDAMAPLSLPNPNSGLDAVTLSDGRLLLVYNHLVSSPHWTVRSPLNVAISQNGSDWDAVLVLESSPGEFSYPAVIQSSNGAIHILYTWNRTNIRHVGLDPAPLLGYSITEGNWPKDAPTLPS